MFLPHLFLSLYEWRVVLKVETNYSMLRSNWIMIKTTEICYAQCKKIKTHTRKKQSNEIWGEQWKSMSIYKYSLLTLSKQFPFCNLFYYWIYSMCCCCSQRKCFWEIFKQMCWEWMCAWWKESHFCWLCIPYFPALSYVWIFQIISAFLMTFSLKFTFQFFPLVQKIDTHILAILLF